ncbi:hypothetical protein SELMODRAFT_404219 [Selaginella moellendorffii]|uniref:PIPK domain-containing protein n=1 Tax=Selaginella moellendorffii TaxID=88036 RepID=D8QUN0_SELML|nr:hypothetical protein SELMODRAFT_404219 [Selaginella moellendorffii]
MALAMVCAMAIVCVAIAPFLLSVAFDAAMAREPTRYCHDPSSRASGNVTAVFPKQIRAMKRLQKNIVNENSTSVHLTPPPQWLPVLTKYLTHQVPGDKPEYSFGGIDGFVNVLFPTQFRTLREVHGFKDDKEFVETLNTARPRTMASSRSGAKFFTTASERVIVKLVSHRDMSALRRIAEDYFLYTQQLETSFAIILGAYEIWPAPMTFSESERLNVLVIEATDPPRSFLQATTIHHDLKGFIKYSVPESDAYFTTPLLLTSFSHRMLFCLIERDTHFLQRQGLTDYSVLVFQTDEEHIFVSVIDYLTTFSRRNAYRHIRINFRIIRGLVMDWIRELLGCVMTEEDIRKRVLEHCIIHPRNYRARLLQALGRNQETSRDLQLVSTRNWNLRFVPKLFFRQASELLKPNALVKYLLSKLFSSTPRRI